MTYTDVSWNLHFYPKGELFCSQPSNMVNFTLYDHSFPLPTQGEGQHKPAEEAATAGQRYWRGWSWPSSTPQNDSLPFPYD